MSSRRLRSDPFGLCVLEGGYTPPPVTAETVVCSDVLGDQAFEDEVRPLLRELALRPVRFGPRDDGFAVTFKTLDEAARFRLFYDGTCVTA